MRALILVVAMVLSMGSAENAQQRHGLRSYACGNNVACQSRANTQYAVESQREIVDQQNQVYAQRLSQQQQMAADARATRRCEGVTRILLTCQLIKPTDAIATRDYCIYSVGPTATSRAYGMTLCYEQAVDCDGLKWCLAH